jgi:hypothetical protein
MRDRLVRCFAGPPVKITVNMYIKSIGPVSETDEVRHFAPSPPVQTFVENKCVHFAWSV